MPLDEYKNMKGLIKDQKELIDELKNQLEPVLTVRIRFEYTNEIFRQYQLDWLNELKPNYKTWLRVKIEEVSENEVVETFVKAVNDKYEAAKSFEESAMQILHGLQKQKLALEEAYKRAPWWCRWAIKPTKEPESARV